MQNQNDWSLKFIELRKTTENEHKESEEAISTLTLETSQTSKRSSNGASTKSSDEFQQICDEDTDDIKEWDTQGTYIGIYDHDEDGVSANLSTTKTSSENLIKINNTSLMPTTNHSISYEQLNTEDNMVSS